MLSLKEFMDVMLQKTEYNGDRIVSREIGFGSKPDVYLNVETEDGGYRRFYSCFNEYKKYKKYIELEKNFSDMW